MKFGASHVAWQRTCAALVEFVHPALGFAGPPGVAQQMYPGSPSDAQLSLLEQLIGTSFVSWQSLKPATHVNSPVVAPTW